jgi:cell filamentation protein
LPNKSGITSAQALGIAEFEGFLQAKIVLTQKINSKTKLYIKYLQEMYRLALGV